MSLRCELMCCTETILREIATKEATRAGVAVTYALCIMSSEEKDWVRVNKAIIARWKLSGMEWIKKRAWKLVEEKRHEPQVP